MKAIVEWGKPKSACKNRPCGVSGQFIVTSAEQARMLASQMFHTLVEGREHVLNNKGAWGVSKKEPRKVVWSGDRTAWVCVTLLDGVARGPYAGLADKEADNPGYDRCPKCGVIAGDRHKLACPGGIGMVEASMDNATPIWYFRQVGIHERKTFYVTAKAYYDSHGRRDPDACRDIKLLGALPAGFRVVGDWLEWTSPDVRVGRQALLDAGFIEYPLA